MTIGVCCGPDLSQTFATAGFDYIELNAQRHLMPQASDAEFAPMRDALVSSTLPCRAANCFLPAALKVTGPAVDRKALDAYAATACRRAHEAGLSVIVFGSGGARHIPDGFPRESAWQQLLEFSRVAGDHAARYHITIAVEPLNRRESNVFSSVAETAAFVRELNHPAVRLLVDAYHWHANGESPDDIIAAAPLIVHAHIATYEQRLFPGDEPCDFAPFFSALKQGGYTGSVSIEAKWDGTPESAARAASLLRQLVL